MSRTDHDIFDELRKLPLDEYKKLCFVLWKKMPDDSADENWRIGHIRSGMRSAVTNPEFLSLRLRICNFLDDYEQRKNQWYKRILRPTANKLMAAAGMIVIGVIIGWICLSIEYGGGYATPAPSTSESSPRAVTPADTSFRPPSVGTTGTYISLGDGDRIGGLDPAGAGVSTKTAEEFGLIVKEGHESLRKTREASEKSRKK